MKVKVGDNVKVGDFVEIKNSNIGDIVYYYESQAPNEIANAIQNASENNSYNARQRLSELDKQFKNKIIQLLYGKR